MITFGKNELVLEISSAVEGIAFFKCRGCLGGSGRGNSSTICDYKPVGPCEKMKRDRLPEP